MPPKPRKASSYTVLRAGDAFVIRPTGARGRGKSGGVRKGKRDKVTKVPAPDPAKSGCHLTGTVYDHAANTTTFMYDCDHAVDAAGHRSYTVTKRGNFFADK